MALEPDDLKQLGQAKLLLESPGLAIKLVNLVGRPLEIGMAHLPVSWSQAVSTLGGYRWIRGGKLDPQAIGDGFRGRGRRFWNFGPDRGTARIHGHHATFHHRYRPQRGGGHPWY